LADGGAIHFGSTLRRAVSLPKEHSQASSSSADTANRNTIIVAGWLGSFFSLRSFLFNKPLYGSRLLLLTLLQSGGC
jgi:hypothetical protein